MREIKKKKERHRCICCHKLSYFISNNGLCKTCMDAKIKSANYQMKSKEGPVYDKWKNKIIAGVERG